jgi:beta-phosphoglucomutase
MQWIYHYQLFLFDFDGVLVDTEHLHYQAYINMCAQHGFQLNWSFDRYSEAAHHQATGVREQIYTEFPELYAQQPNWQILYEEKKHIFLALLENTAAPLLPGAADLLLSLKEACIQCCVVTHSSASLILKIRLQNPILDIIPHWITREDYTHPKPHPECYHIAIAKLAKSQDRIIGFEDSPRGLHALLKTQAKPILICPLDSPYLKKTLHTHTHVRHYQNFTAITDENPP